MSPTETPEEEVSRLKEHLRILETQNNSFERSVKWSQMVGVVFGILVLAGGGWIRFNQMGWQIDQLSTLKIETRLQAVEMQKSDLQDLKNQMSAMQKDIEEIKNAQVRTAQQIADFMAKK